MWRLTSSAPDFSAGAGAGADGASADSASPSGAASTSNLTPMLWRSTRVMASRTRSFFPLRSSIFTKVSWWAP